MPSLSGARQKRWERRAFAWSQRNADRVICQSKAMAGDVVPASRVNPENLLVVYNPVTPAQNDAVTGANHSAATHFLAVGRLASRKTIGSGDPRVRDSEAPALRERDSDNHG